MTAQLIKYDAMCAAIEAAHAVDEVKGIRDRAAALEACARIAQNTHAEQQARTIRIRAERKAGQLLAEMPKAEGAKGNPGGQGARIVRSQGTTTQTLKDLGITKDQSSQWQKLGAMPKDDFELAIGNSVLPPSTAGILRSCDQQRQRIGSPEAIWLWGRLHDFERDGLLDMSPTGIIATLPDIAKDDIHRLAPKVAAWLKLVGATQ